MKDGAGSGVSFKRDRTSGIAAFAGGDIQRELSEQRDAEPRGFPPASAFAKKVIFHAVAGALEIAHVFDDARESGTLTFANIEAALRASMSATSCGWSR